LYIDFGGIKIIPTASIFSHIVEVSRYSLNIKGSMFIYNRDLATISKHQMEKINKEAALKKDNVDVDGYVCCGAGKEGVTFEDIRKWAQEKGIYDSGDLKTQTLKLVEESGELAQAVLNNDLPEIEDAIGDAVVVLTSIAHLAGLKIEDCMQAAYDVITKRTGKMVDGTFVKD
jgi:NTP pyrophosphatase (non-canonical NTP hydrolase)